MKSTARRRGARGSRTAPTTRRRRTVVSSDESVGVLVLELAVDVLFGLLHGNVHEAVQAAQDACGRAGGSRERQRTPCTAGAALTVVLDAAVQLHDDALADDELQKIRRLLRRHALRRFSAANNSPTRGARVHTRKQRETASGAREPTTTSGASNNESGAPRKSRHRAHGRSWLAACEVFCVFFSLSRWRARRGARYLAAAASNFKHSDEMTANQAGIVNSDIR